MHRLCWTLVLLLLCAAENTAERVARVGNDATPSLSGVDSPRTAFLLTERVRHEGVVFAFAAFFRSPRPVRFQIWREEEDKDEFRLLAEIPHIPGVNMLKPWGREDIYIESKMKECIHVLPGDHLGVFFETVSAPVAFTFQPKTPRVLATTLKNNKTEFELGDRVRFDPLVFPYDFSVAAYFDTSMDGYQHGDGAGVSDANATFVPCPRGLLIPSPSAAESTFSTPRPEGIGGQGATGATGAMGPSGPTGATGFQGPSGNQGVQGPTGATGLQGRPGLQGLQGERGPKGLDGRTGVTGPTGATGATGARGEKGEAGPPGLPGRVIYKNVTVSAKASDGTQPLADLSNPYTLGLLVWLVILTFLILVVLICACVHDHRSKALRKFTKSFQGPRNLSRRNNTSELLLAYDQVASTPPWVPSTSPPAESASVTNEALQRPDINLSARSRNYFTAGLTNPAMENSVRGYPTEAMLF